MSKAGTKEHASAVWDPHQKFNQVKLEMVQRRAARFVKSRYKRTDSVTAMLDKLGWPILSKRRKDARLILFYKIINNLAQVPHEFGVFKLLDKIDVSKASGPDCIPGRILQNLAQELAPVLHFIFEQSLNTGDIPAEWTLANVAPIFKKGSKLQAVNYRPVSLTCISCKLFEHIVCKHILGHLEDHEILTDLQHGFRSGRSCETQLITTFHDIASAYNKKGSQIDIAVLDFSKAFDTVPHDGLLSKLKHYGIDDKIWLWILNFLKQRVVVDGIQSDLVTVDSGVPQGTVLGPILFLLHINDLPSVISSKVRLFADDCLVYREIKNRQDQIALQKDLNLLENWGSKWGMRFNAAKCNIMRMSRKQTPISTQYELSGQVLEEVKDAKYLGVTVSDDLE